MRNGVKMYTVDIGDYNLCITDQSICFAGWTLPLNEIEGIQVKRSDIGETRDIDHHLKWFAGGRQHRATERVQARPGSPPLNTGSDRR